MSRIQAERKPVLTTYRRTHDGSLIAGLVAIPLAIGTIALGYQRSEPATPVRSEFPVPSPTATNDTQVRKILQARELLVAALEQPGSSLLADFRDGYDRKGLKVRSFYDCSSDPEATKRSFVNPATERKAPFRIAKAISEIAAGTQFSAPIEVAIYQLMGKTPEETWMANIKGENISWAIKEQGYRDSIIRQYAINVWPGSAQTSCTPFQLSYDYTKENPPKSPK